MDTITMWLATRKAWFFAITAAVVIGAFVLINLNEKLEVTTVFPLIPDERNQSRTVVPESQSMQKQSVSSIAEPKTMQDVSTFTNAEPKIMKDAGMPTNAESKTLKDVNTITNEEPKIMQDVSTITNAKPKIMKDVSMITNAEPKIMKDVNTITNEEPKIMQDISTITNAKPKIMKDVSMITNAEPKIMKDVNTITNEEPKIMQDIRTITNGKPKIMKDVSTITNAEPKIMKDAGTPTNAESKTLKDVNTITNEVPKIMKDVSTITNAKLKIMKDVGPTTNAEPNIVQDVSTATVIESLSTQDQSMAVTDEPKCKIPMLDPLHSSVKQLIKHLPDLICDAPSFITAENTTLRILKNKLSDGSSCFVQSINRKDEDHSELGAPIRMDKHSIVATSEFLKVECKNRVSDGILYTQFYPFILHKEAVEKRIEIIKEKLRPKHEQLRIIMLGLDSVSRNQFLRHMLKTREFIKQKLTYAEFTGYNKVGKNTYANMVPMFNGKLEYEVPDTSKEPTDVLPFIWKEYMQTGYKTLFAEDLPQGSIFNYGRKGFTKEPMDYYLRPWSLAVEPYIKGWKTGCLNERVEANVILKYMEDFYDLFPNDPLFAFTFLTRMSHDYINELSYQDKPVRDYLERLYLKGHFNNTVMFLFGDHGFRFGPIRSTYVGRMEGRLPFMFVIVPPWFPNKYPQLYQNLKLNEKRLTTPLDIYATLKSLLHFNETGYDREGVGRSISLFNYKIPFNRTCEDASIKAQWCACVTSEPISLEDWRVNVSATKIVKKINEYTERYRTKCAKLSLASVHNASKQDVGLGEDAVRDGYSNYLVTVQVLPSNGIFEGSVWVNNDDSFSVDDTIERINLYKNQSVCVEENALKPYCYCVN